MVLDILIAFPAKFEANNIFIELYLLGLFIYGSKFLRESSKDFLQKLN